MRAWKRFCAFSIEIIAINRQLSDLANQVNAATQENSAGVEKIEDMVVRIRRMAEE